MQCNALRGQLADANSRYATAAASEAGIDATKIIRGLRDHQFHLSEECSTMSAFLLELNMKLVSSRQQADGTISKMQLEMAHATATMTKMSEDHAFDMRNMREAILAAKSRNLKSYNLLVC